MPDRIVPGSTSPAWDPSSRTPGHSTSAHSEWGNSLWPEEGDSSATFTHWILNPKLVGKRIHGKYNDSFVSVTPSANGELRINRRNGPGDVIQPVDFVPKHPTSRDHHRFVVIKGDHCGKYVRPISYRYIGSDSNSPVMMKVAVVELQHKAEDRLLEERLEIMAAEMSVADEKAAEKTLNATLRTRLLQR